ncbi:formate/nitrite transporter family protein [Halomonas salifodinae]|uniref:formate/nitrite transporter family protein n=1 Tax=Halomonas salifodinae TaxID=438745 RepID=UPI0033B991D2
MVTKPRPSRPARDPGSLFGDAYQPQQIAQRVANMGVAKARADGPTLLVLATLAGAFISLGALLFTVIITDSSLGFGVTRLLGGLGFCLGLILVVVGGAELFTGNNLLAMAWASRLVTTREVLRNWGLVYLGNIIGCLGTVLLVMLANVGNLGDGSVGITALRIAQAKAELAPLEAFARGILCNVLVCLAIWLAMGGHSVTDRILAIVLPISAFVTLGFEHSIANWFFLPLGLALGGPEGPTLGAALHNLAVVSAGNIVGGTLLVAGVYWLAYLRPPSRPTGDDPT